MAKFDIVVAAVAYNEHNIARAAAAVVATFVFVAAYEQIHFVVLVGGKHVSIATLLDNSIL